MTIKGIAYYNDDGKLITLVSGDQVSECDLLNTFYDKIDSDDIELVFTELFDSERICFDILEQHNFKPMVGEHDVRWSVRWSKEKRKISFPRFAF